MGSFNKAFKPIDSAVELPVIFGGVDYGMTFRLLPEGHERAQEIMSLETPLVKITQLQKYYSAIAEIVKAGGQPEDIDLSDFFEKGSDLKQIKQYTLASHIVGWSGVTDEVNGKEVEVAYSFKQALNMIVESKAFYDWVEKSISELALAKAEIDLNVEDLKKKSEIGSSGTSSGETSQD